MKALVGAFNQEKALVGAFSMIVQLHRLIDLRHYHRLRLSDLQVLEPGVLVHSWPHPPLSAAHSSMSRQVRVAGSRPWPGWQLHS